MLITAVKHISEKAECSNQLTALQTGNEQRVWPGRVHHWRSRDWGQQNWLVASPFRRNSVRIKNFMKMRDFSENLRDHF